MKIAFVGKGGSGKSTITSLFTSFLLSQNKKMLVIDADLNIHIPHLLNIPYKKEKAISLNENTNAIKTFIKGKNKKIKNIDEIYKTTPPAVGSNFLELKAQNEIIKKYTKKFDKNAYFMFVGTYENGEIGRSCYHTNLSIFENLLSHSNINNGEWIVCDMVAGIDAFSNTLHAQFDAIILVVEPSIESIEVFNQYKEMLTISGNYDDLVIVGNKIEDKDDLNFVLKHIDQDKFIGHFKASSKIKKARQRDEKITLDLLDANSLKTLDKIYEKSLALKKPSAEMLERLYSLHLKYIDQDYVRLAVGDISHQIDKDFSYE